MKIIQIKTRGIIRDTNKILEKNLLELHSQGYNEFKIVYTPWGGSFLNWFLGFLFTATRMTIIATKINK